AMTFPGVRLLLRMLRVHHRPLSLRLDPITERIGRLFGPKTQGDSGTFHMKPRAHHRQLNGHAHTIAEDIALYEPTRPTSARHRVLVPRRGLRTRCPSHSVTTVRRPRRAGRPRLAGVRSRTKMAPLTGGM